MALGRTTRCCRFLVALLAVLLSAFAGPDASLLAAEAAGSPAVPFLKRSPKAAPPLGLFPVVSEWTIKLNAEIVAPPAYDDRRGYYPIENDRIVAYDLITGKRLWIATARTAIAPVAGDDLLFVVLADGVEALHAADGSVAWQLPFKEPLATGLTWDTGWLVAATQAGSILALRASDGVLLWRHELGAAAGARPKLAADRVYVPLSDGRVVALALADGHQVWNQQLGGAATDLLPLQETLFVGSKDNYLYCLRTRDGSRAWRWRTGGDVIGVPAVDEDSVYFVSLDNVLRALRRSSGVQRWKRALAFRPTSGVLKAGDTLLVNGLATSLQGFSAKDGSPAGNVKLDGEPAAPPRLLDRPGTFAPLVLVCTQDLANGAAIRASTRSIDPEIVDVAPLPNVTKPAPLPPARPTASR